MKAFVLIILIIAVVVWSLASLFAVIATIDEKNFSTDINGWRFLAVISAFCLANLISFVIAVVYIIYH